MRSEVKITLGDFVTAAKKAGEQDNWLAALALAITLPDICASVDEPGEKSGPRYRRWWDHYVAPSYIARPDPGEQWEAHSYLPGRDAYYLRCSYLHAGTDTNFRPDSLMRRVRFVGPNNSRWMGLDEESRTLSIPIDMFVETVCVGVRQWIADRVSDAEAQVRLLGLISVLPPAFTIVENGKARRWPRD